MSAEVTSPSGEQYVIRRGPQEATIVEVGGGLRTYAVDGRDVIQPYAVDALCPAAHGAVLAPWPNRVGDGRYAFDGEQHQLDLSEPDQRNAIHGLVRWLGWSATDVRPDGVTMAVRLHASKGFPFTLDVVVDRQLDDVGLTVTTTATNIGSTACPYALGHHPYLSAGPDATLDHCTLEAAGSTRITTDERQLPVGREPLEGTPFDFRRPAAIGPLSIDDPFTDLVRDHDGRAWVRLSGPDGRTAQLWADEAFPVLQLYTGDRGGLAAEPMTAPPDALRTGDHLTRLEPGASTTSAYGLQLA